MLKSNIPGCQPGIENRQANAKENKFFIHLPSVGNELCSEYFRR